MEIIGDSWPGDISSKEQKFYDLVNKLKQQIKDFESNTNRLAETKSNLELQQLKQQNERIKKQTELELEELRLHYEQNYDDVYKYESIIFVNGIPFEKLDKISTHSNLLNEKMRQYEEEINYLQKQIRELTAAQKKTEPVTRVNFRGAESHVNNLKQLNETLRAEVVDLTNDLKSTKEQLEQTKFRQNGDEIVTRDKLDNIKQEVIEKIRLNVLEDIKCQEVKNIRYEIMQSMKDEFFDEIRAELVEEIRLEEIDGIRKELIGEIRKIESEKIRTDVSAQFKEELTKKLRNEIFEDIRTEVVTSLKEKLAEKIRREERDKIRLEELNKIRIEEIKRLEQEENEKNKKKRIEKQCQQALEVKCEEITYLQDEIARFKDEEIEVLKSEIENVKKYILELEKCNDNLLVDNSNLTNYFRETIRCYEEILMNMKRSIKTGKRLHGSTCLDAIKL